ncbi:MAG: DUF5058 family protein [Candidatus Izemoplasmatales bacterium]|jgi:hypothetical protein|nr:DUF5058 family protein [Candidatus Izemoplasmatales bacterium]MDD4595564.1 DUF5058 family protein [Candidatus Izemoplasmatales bacterium]
MLLITRFAATTVGEVKESWWMYALAIFVALFILAGSIYFMYSAYRQSKKLNMSKDQVRKAVVSSISFSVLPSIGIFIGVITMSGLLGIPLPWIRLSVVGALHYELMAASVASTGITLATMTIENFVTIAFVMTISIMWGGLFALFFFKKYQIKVINKATSTDGKGFGKILFDAFFIGMICAYIGDAVAKIIKYEVRVIEDGAYVLDLEGNYVTENKATFVPIIVMISAMGAMAFFDWLVRKKNIKWLENFSLALSMIFGMAVAVFLGMGGIY